jgi:hypothetical protein
MTRSLLFALAVAWLPAGPVWAAEDIPPPPAEQQTLETFGAAEAACLAWSDGCATCKRDDAGAAHCSTTGIACQPGAIACTEKRP